jgi:integrase
MHLASWKPNPQRLLFATRNGTPIEAALILKRKLYPLLNKLGIPKGGFHAFRHGNSTLLDHLCIPLKVRQEQLGHSDVAFMIERYTHISSGDEQRLIRELGSSLKPASAK